MQEVDFDLVGSEIDYKPILKKLEDMAKNG